MPEELQRCCPGESLRNGSEMRLCSRDRLSRSMALSGGALSGLVDVRALVNDSAAPCGRRDPRNSNKQGAVYRLRIAAPGPKKNKKKKHHKHHQNKQRTPGPWTQTHRPRRSCCHE